MASSSSSSAAASTMSYPREDSAADTTPVTPNAQPPTSSITDTITRFTMLYFTSFFSLDPFTAARRSPYSVTNPTIPDHLRPTGRDYGEGENVGRRLDPGGPWRREGRIHNDGRNITVPAGCKSCKYNAAPTIG